MANQPERIVELSRQVERISHDKIASIVDINQQARYLSLNARIEAARSGEAGRGFAVVANQVQHVSEQITEIADSLRQELAGSIADLALNMIETMDRNLYERSCDVRWWATDAAVVDVLEDGSAAARHHASQRLGVILDSYTVYLDLWVADASGRVVACGRPARYPGVVGSDVSHAQWFRRGMATASGSDYVAQDIDVEPRLGGAQVAAYATAIRAGGQRDGKPLGVLGIFFDWAHQAGTVVRSVGLSEEEWGRTRCLLVDANYRVIAASDGKGVLADRHYLQAEARRGHYQNAEQALVGYALTPGYETYTGMGWYGVVVQQPSDRFG
ncbi:Methyl-accepting chemotaxis protein [plant metagenome]|uniref:Methyl-accepting chemotaxis protein n=1 Tax=plant metagenome TaxID=1297885 RepID=A0A484TR29_9ZZZZ